MSGCDGWISIKILELALAAFCIIYKRVTDDEANKLFYFLQKYSREWPLLNNITWEENGAIFTDITYGGFVIIVTGLIIAQASGELQHHRKMENFFLIVGAFMFIASGSLELAALDSVEERLVDNAAILGVFSLLTGFVFILDLLLAGKRRKKYKSSNAKKRSIPKATQTEEAKLAEFHKSSDMNGNIQSSGYHDRESFPKTETKKAPRNGVKILPSSPALEEGSGFKISPPVYAPNDLKTPDAKIRSTESFLRSEKGEYLRRNLAETPKDHIYIPPGYVLMPVSQLDFKDESLSDGKRESVTPPGYATVIMDMKNKSFKTSPGYMVVPVDQIDPKNEDGTRKLQSPTITTTVKSPQSYYDEYFLGRTPQPSITNLSLSDLSDADDRRKSPGGVMFKKVGKYSPEYLQMDTKGSKYDESVNVTKPTFFSDPYQRSDSRLSHKSLQDHLYPMRGRRKQNAEDETDDASFRQLNSSQRSNKPRVPDKPKSILRFEGVRPSSKTDDDGKDARFDSLDSRKIAEDLRHLREITRTEQEPASDLEDESESLRRRSKVQKERLQISRMDAKKMVDDDMRSYPQRKMLEERINELEDMERLRKLEKKVRDLEAAKVRDLEDEKDRRMSEREEQYFGILDLRQSQRESSPVARVALADIEKKMKMQEDGEGAKKTNEKLKEKFYEQEDKAREDQDYRKIIDEGFYFIDEEERKLKNLRGSRGRSGGKPQLSGMAGTHRELPQEGKGEKSPSPNGSDETLPSQTTDEEIRLRIETPTSSYKSEAQMWLGSETERGRTTPTSPGDPGYVLHTAQNWPETPSPSPQDRFRFSARSAQKLKMESKSPSPDTEDEEKSSKFDQRGVAHRRVDFTEVPVREIRRPSTVLGSTSSWKKWLQPKPKFHHTKSAPT